MLPMTPLIVSMFRDASTSLAGRLDTAPNVDMYRRDDRFHVHVDLPGVASGSVDVRVEGSTLVVSGERVYAPEPGDRVYLAERPFGRFERRFRLPEPVDASKVTAELADGVLTVVVPFSAPGASRVPVVVRPLAESTDK